MRCSDLGTAVVHLTASDGAVFVVHENLLDYHSDSWPVHLDQTDNGEVKDLSYWKDDYNNQYQYRGLIHWLYHQELPSDDLIRQSGYPKHWNEGKEKEPLACKMDRLANDIMTFLFDRYMVQGIPPSLRRVSKILGGNDMAMPLVEFCVDIYCKLNVESFGNLQTAVDENMSKYPKKLLFAMFHRQSVRKHQQVQDTQKAASSDSSILSQDTVLPAATMEPWVMKLCDYHAHWNCDGSLILDVDRCKCSTMKEHYIIE
ncbi:hypothetical protein K491DRAFT_726725 [Lophiostoma macrostomum CBS 122681]|uniref:BTB domain-containing protein n=1 Tax=Lophiostoma macrostomum CBS 122681 TaxID=1314788 RepID=A0A6A6SY28_9PLEO|nr:hypothetical protein K491DRAFT_726725 [Lophiostoma macrostomum CBS 122681]